MWFALKIQHFEVLPVCLCPQVLLMNKEINPAELDFLLRYPVQPGVTSPVDFLSNHSWGGIKVLAEMAVFLPLLKCNYNGKIQRVQPDQMYS